MAKKNPNYWSQRMTDIEDAQYQKSAAYYKDVQAQFRGASNSIQRDIERWYLRLAENNDISYAGAKRLLKRDELDEFHWTVQQYIKVGEENAVNQHWGKELENASVRHHISYLEAMKLQIQQHVELLTKGFDNDMADFLHKSYGEQYYQNAFEIAKGTGIGSNLAKLDNRKVNSLLQKPWAQDKKNFSDRIWTNKEKLVNNLHTELTQNVIRGASPQKAIDSMAKTMKVGRAQAGRLIMTESAAVSSMAQKDCFKELEVEQYEILATLDSLTSKLCQEMDGKVFGMNDYEVGITAPPFHPNCRSTTVPYFDDEFTDGEERAARDQETGGTVYVDGNLKYSEWKEQMLNTEPKTETYANILQDDIIKADSEKKYTFIDEEHYDELIEQHRSNISEKDRNNMNGFDWDNFREGNAEYGFINTENSFKINEAIRTDTIPELLPESQETIVSLLNAVSDNKIDEDILAHRYVDEAWFRDKVPSLSGDKLSDIQKMIENKVILKDNQFISCSLNENVSYIERNIEMVFKVPKGTNAYVTENRMESEIIMYKPEYLIEKAEKVIAQDGTEKIVLTCKIRG